DRPLSRDARAVYLRSHSRSDERLVAKVTSITRIISKEMKQMSHPSTRSSNGDHGVAVPPFELNRQVPCVADVDVLVLGGGPAGIGTAVAAGREGAKVALVEQYG